MIIEDVEIYNLIKDLESNFMMIVLLIFIMKVYCLKDMDMMSM